MPDSTKLPHLSGREDTRVTEYRAVSGSAVAALLVGLVSPVALMSEWLALVPALALLLAAIALVRIRMHASELLGRTPAVIALALATASLSAALTDAVYTRWLIATEARQFTGQWLTSLPAGDDRAVALREQLGEQQSVSEVAHVETVGPARRNAQWIVAEIYRIRLTGPGEQHDKVLVRLELQRTNQADGTAAWRVRYAEVVD